MNLAFYRSIFPFTPSACGSTPNPFWTAPLPRGTISLAKKMQKLLLLVLPLLLGLLPAEAAPKNSDSAAKPNPRSPGAVTLSEDDRSFTLFNGLLAARVEKRSGNLISLHYQGVELLAQDHRGASGGYWSSVGRGRPGPNSSAVVRINPATNGGDRAEISCRFLNNPKSPRNPLDADYRYSLGRGEHWLYAYAVLEHKPGFPAFSVAEARYCLKLNPNIFDFLNIDADRRREMPSGYDWDHGTPLNLKEARRMTTGIHKGEPEHKYDYSAVLADTPAYGWLSTSQRLGLWFINPSIEYLGGGPTKVELTGHLDVNPGGLPVLLNMWVGSHYGGTDASVGTNELWTKVVGPFALYCNAASFQGGNKTTSLARDVLWRDALQHASAESNAWPYAWLSDPNYPPAATRGTITGELSLRDPFNPNPKMSNIWVGLTAPEWTPPPKLGPAPENGFPTTVDWQRDAKFYQFWTRADAQGKFTLQHIRPGSYVLHVFADGVLGELVRPGISISAGETRSLGHLEWTASRFGRTVWESACPTVPRASFATATNSGIGASTSTISGNFPRMLISSSAQAIGDAIGTTSSHLASRHGMFLLPARKRRRTRATLNRRLRKTASSAARPGLLRSPCRTVQAGGPLSAWPFAAPIAAATSRPS